MSKLHIYKNEKGEVVYKKRYNAKGLQTYHEDSYDFWWKKRYNAKGTMTHYEDSTGTVITPVE